MSDIKSGDNQGHLHKLQNEDFTVERGKVVFKGNHIVQGKQNIDSIKVKFIGTYLHAYLSMYVTSPIQIGMGQVDPGELTQGRA